MGDILLLAGPPARFQTSTTINTPVSQPSSFDHALRYRINLVTHIGRCCGRTEELLWQFRTVLPVRVLNRWAYQSALCRTVWSRWLDCRPDRMDLVAFYHDECLTKRLLSAVASTRAVLARAGLPLRARDRFEEIWKGYPD